MEDGLSAIDKTADDFAEFFQTKIDNIDRSTADAPPPVIVDRPCTRLSEFTEVTVDEVSRIVMQAPAKQGALDTAPTWLAKRLLPLLANICNSTFQEGLFPDILKRPIDRPRPKKPGLTTNDLSSYRPISNLCFVSKVIERAVMARLTARIESQRLFPCCHFAYRKHHSIEKAVSVMHDEILSTP